MTTLFRRLAAPAAGLLLLTALGMAAFDTQAQEMDMEAEGDANAPIAQTLDEAAMQIQRLRHQLRRLEWQVQRLQRTMSGAMGMMSQMPMMGQGMMGQGMAPGMGQSMMGMPGQMPMQGMGMMGQMPMMGQGMDMMGQMPMMDHQGMMGMPGQMPMQGMNMMGQGMMEPGMGMMDAEDPASLAFWQANRRMHQAMNIAFTGDADRDFVASMIPHHQGAIEMAEIVLKHGKDPQVKKLAEAVIAAQKAEIAEMEAWLKNHPQ